MIASILRMPGPPGDLGADQFARFVRDTKGVVHCYRLGSDNETAVVTIWSDEASRDAYMKTALKQEIDGSYPGQTRAVYSVLASK